MTERKALTMQEAAKTLGICKATLAKMIKAGDIKSVRFGKKLILIPTEALEEFLKTK